MDEFAALLLMLMCRVVVIQIVQKIGFPIEFVKQTTRKSESFVQKFDRSNKRRRQDVLQPLEAGVRDGHTQQQYQMLQIRMRSELFVQAIEDNLIRFWVIDLMAGTLGPRVDSAKGNSGTKLTVNAATMLFNIRTRFLSNYK